MSIDWDQSRIDLAASAYVRTVMAQRVVYMDQRFVAGVEEDRIVLSTEGVAAEYGGAPWVMEAIRGDHQGS